MLLSELYKVEGGRIVKRTYDSKTSDEDYKGYKINKISEGYEVISPKRGFKTVYKNALKEQGSITIEEVKRGIDERISKGFDSNDTLSNEQLKSKIESLEKDLYNARVRKDVDEERKIVKQITELKNSNDSKDADISVELDKIGKALKKAEIDYIDKPGKLAQVKRELKAKVDKLRESQDSKDDWSPEAREKAIEARRGNAKGKEENEKTSKELSSGLKSWVEAYKAARHRGDVSEVKKIYANIESKIKEHGLNRKEVYGEDSDDPKNKTKDSLVADLQVKASKARSMGYASDGYDAEIEKLQEDSEKIAIVRKTDNGWEGEIRDEYGDVESATTGNSKEYVLRWAKEHGASVKFKDSKDEMSKEEWTKLFKELENKRDEAKRKGDTKEAEKIDKEINEKFNKAAFPKDSKNDKDEYVGEVIEGSNKMQRYNELKAKGYIVLSETENKIWMALPKKIKDSKDAMIAVRCTYENGQIIETNINGPIEQTKNYFEGKYFNLGHNDQDKMVKCVKVEQINDFKDDKDLLTQDPLTEKGKEIMGAMKEQYGEKGESVFYASKNKGTIEGVDAKDAEIREGDRFMTPMGNGEVVAIHKQLNPIMYVLRIISGNSFGSRHAYEEKYLRKYVNFQAQDSLIADLQTKAIKARSMGYDSEPYEKEIEKLEKDSENLSLQGLFKWLKKDWATPGEIKRYVDINGGSPDNAIKLIKEYGFREEVNY